MFIHFIAYLSNSISTFKLKSDLFKGDTELDTSKELSRPTTTENWGWCADWCGASQEPAKTLKVRSYPKNLLKVGSNTKRNSNPF